MLMYLGSVAYISTQFLMETSLSQDVSKFDFNVPVGAFSHHSSSTPSDVSPKDVEIKQEDSPSPTGDEVGGKSETF